MKRTLNQTYSLCPDCDACPEVKFYEDGRVTIGEASNVVTLRREEWNQLARGIRAGTLGEL